MRADVTRGLAGRRCFLASLAQSSPFTYSMGSNQVDCLRKSHPYRATEKLHENSPRHRARLRNRFRCQRLCRGSLEQSNYGSPAHDSDPRSTPSRPHDPFTPNRLSTSHDPFAPRSCRGAAQRPPLKDFCSASLVLGLRQQDRSRGRCSTSWRRKPKSIRCLRRRKPMHNARGHRVCRPSE